MIEGETSLILNPSKYDSHIGTFAIFRDVLTLNLHLEKALNRARGSQLTACHYDSTVCLLSVAETTLIGNKDFAYFSSAYQISPDVD
jgi:hypothetical protein